MRGELEQSGEIRIEVSSMEETCYFVVGGEKYTSAEFAEMCSVYEGFTLKYEFI